MNIKLDFDTWMKFAETVNLSFVRAVNSTTTKWEEIGLKAVSTNKLDLSKEFEIIDKQKYFLGKIKYGI
jgi:hypothetical protein